MKRTDKFFLNYCKGLHYNKPISGQMNIRCEQIYKDFMSTSDHLIFVLLMPKQERINLLLFCAAENGEL